MALHTHLKSAKRVEIEIEIGAYLFSINVWAKFAREASEAIQALFDSLHNKRNPNCAYFQNRLASIELAFGY